MIAQLKDRRPSIAASQTLEAPLKIPHMPVKFPVPRSLALDIIIDIYERERLLWMQIFRKFLLTIADLLKDDLDSFLNLEERRWESAPIITHESSTQQG